MYEGLEKETENKTLSSIAKGKKVLVIDNYDSFVYNLVQYIGELGAETVVIRNDAIQAESIIDEIQNKIKPSHILISPGPGKPEDAGLSNKIIKELKGQIPILGVCLGHQAIGENFGAKVSKAPYLMHGKTSQIFHDQDSALFDQVPNPFTATRYHSLIVEDVNNESKLKIEAKTDDGLIMALSHKDCPSLLGVQFHPESILSEYGHKILANFLCL